MCGIVGEIHFDGAPYNPESLTAAIDRLKPRGPDHQGMYARGNYAFGHTRLSIIDLSSAGDQPMVLADDELVITYNGEIYNYRELRAELKDLGAQFKTDSDTEVLGKAYRFWGENFVKRLHGMFAFVINDQRKNLYIFARDRFGIKPLYYYASAKEILFASNIRALKCYPQVSSELDREALHCYMSLHAIVPAPKTIFKDVKKLPAAHVLVVSADGTSQQIKKYWSPQYELGHSVPASSEREWEELITVALKKAVERRLVADVPVGLFLSGGVDSSLIAALMAERMDRPIESFSVGFSAVSGEAGNEFKYSDIVSKKFATNHHQISVSTQELLENLDDCIAHMNEPMVSYDNIGFYLLSKYSARHVKVVQSGQGADEIFGGYHWYQELANAHDGASSYKKLFFDRPHQKMQEVLTAAYLSDDYSSKFIDREFSLYPHLHPVDQALRIDTLTMLVEDPVKRVDSNTMAWGLEARVPFLDHELVELACQMPFELKIKGGGKYLLKKIAKKYIPAQVIDRPKGYFPVPQLKYIEGPFLDYVKQFITRDRIEKRGVFKWDYVQGLLKNPKAHITPLQGSELWQIAVLERWLENYDR